MMKIYHIAIGWCIGLLFSIDGLCEVSKENSYPSQKVVISEVAPFINGIENAQEFLYIGSYKLHDHLLPNPNITTALEKVARRDSLKNKILIILESHLTKEEQKEGNRSVHTGDSLKTYEDLGIDLTGGCSRFTATHYKILVSQNFAFVGTTNFDKNFEEINEDGSTTLVRDFSIILTEPYLIKELKQVVDNDRLNVKNDMVIFNIDDINEGDSRLSWGPNQHYQHFQQLIRKANNSIEIYQQALQDDDLTNLLAEAVKRGVKVSILMSEFPFGKKHGNKSEKAQHIIASSQSADGRIRGEVRLTGPLLKDGDLGNKRLHIHAKVIIIDGKIMYLGSANFYTPALKKDRNVGVITRNLEYIKPVQTQFKIDWNAHRNYGVAPKP